MIAPKLHVAIDERRSGIVPIILALGEYEKMRNRRALTDSHPADAFPLSEWRPIHS